MAKRGTLVNIDEAELEKLGSLQCTDEEIAAWFGVTTRTIERRRKAPRFAEILARGKAKGRISFRRQQMKLLEKGNATMGIWLGKQLLGQRDQLDHHVEEGPRVLRAIIIPKIGETMDAVFPPGIRPPSPMRFLPSRAIESTSAIDVVGSPKSDEGD